MCTMRAAGCGDVTSATWRVPGMAMSAAKRPLPTTKRRSSRTRRSDETKRKLFVGALMSRSLACLLAGSSRVTLAGTSSRITFRRNSSRSGHYLEGDHSASPLSSTRSSSEESFTTTRGGRRREQTRTAPASDAIALGLPLRVGAPDSGQGDTGSNDRLAASPGLPLLRTNVQGGVPPRRGRAQTRRLVA